MGLRSHEEPPVIGIDASARIVDPTALDAFLLKDLVDSLQARSILLTKLYVQPCLGARRHSAVCVEVTSDIGETRAGPDQARGIEADGQEVRRGLHDPVVAVSTFSIDPASVPKGTKQVRDAFEPCPFGLAIPMRPMKGTPCGVFEGSLEICLHICCARRVKGFGV